MTPAARALAFRFADQHAASRRAVVRVTADTATFDGDPRAALAAVLRQAADQVERDGATNTFGLRTASGHVCGSVDLLGPPRKWK